MKFVKSVGIGDVRTRIANARYIDESGLDALTVPDSQSMQAELFTVLGRIAGETSTVDLGPMVTNPVTRHPAVTASAICTLDRFTDGRAFLGMGSGDSAVHALGERPARLGELTETMELVRDLCRGETAEYNGNEIQLHWVDQSSHAFEIPLIMTAEGPKTLEAAGEVADKVVVGLGLLPEVIEECVRRVNEGARRAGRNPDDVETWFTAYCNVGDDYETAVARIKHWVADAAHHSLQYTFEGKQVPREYRDAVKQLLAEYSTEYTRPEVREHNAHLVDQLGLTEYLAERYLIAGSPRDCTNKLNEIEATGLVDGLFLIEHEETPGPPSRLYEEVISGR